MRNSQGAPIANVEFPQAVDWAEGGRRGCSAFSPMLRFPSMPNPLPPLNAVRVFEAAARHLNFARTAEELGVTSSAVSKQIGILEDYIGGQLFERSNTGLVLTLEGRELKHSLEPAFEMLASSFQRYSRRPPRSTKFRLATVASFAAEFLVPRLKRFEAHFPDIELEVLTSDRLLDLSREEVDLSVRYGPGDWPSVVSHKLSSGLLLPVGKGTLAADPDEESVEVTAPRRIQVFSTNEWLQWVPPTDSEIQDSQPPIVMEHFLVALRAAMSGFGIALLPDVIVSDRIAQGDLVQLGDAVNWPHAFYLAHIPDARRSERTERVMDWIQTEVTQSLGSAER